ncbi:hypothetical protein [Oceanobacter kriegii]|nr:hypothetical protein [Oceanobacter kriegii]
MAVLEDQQKVKLLILKGKFGRDGGIRTRDPLHPMQQGFSIKINNLYRIA